MRFHPSRARGTTGTYPLEGLKTTRPRCSHQGSRRLEARRMPFRPFITTGTFLSVDGTRTICPLLPTMKRHPLLVSATTGIFLSVDGMKMSRPPLPAMSYRLEVYRLPTLTRRRRRRLPPSRSAVTIFTYLSVDGAETVYHPLPITIHRLFLTRVTTSTFLLVG